MLDSTLRDRPQTDRPPSEFADQLPLLYRFASLAEGDPRRAELRGSIVLTFLPVAERMAKRHSGPHSMVRDDLRQVASEAVVRAVDRWDPDLARGDFLGYLVPCVRGEIMRYFRDQSWSMRVPRRLKDLGMALRRVQGPLSQEFGRAPRPSELARRLDVEVSEVVEALQAEESHRTASLDAPGPDGEPSRAEHLGSVDERLDLVEDIHVLRPLLDALPARERRILLMRFYGDCTQTQIAEQLGISQMHVSRLLSQTLARLRTAMLDDSPLA